MIPLKFKATGQRAKPKLVSEFCFPPPDVLVSAVPVSCHVTECVALLAVAVQTSLHML